MIRTTLLAAGLLGAPAAMAQANPVLKAYDPAVVRRAAEKQGIVVTGAGTDAATQAPYLTLQREGGLAFRAVGAACRGKGAAQVCRSLVLEATYALPPTLEFDAYAASFNGAWKPTRIFWNGARVVCTLEFPITGARRKQADLDAALKDYADTATALTGVMKQ